MPVLIKAGKYIGKSIRFANDREGFQRLITWMELRLPEGEDICIGMEATGHYWLALYSFLHEQGLRIHVINPIQSDSLRNFHIRQQKTDAVDCFLIVYISGCLFFFKKNNIYCWFLRNIV